MHVSMFVRLLLVLALGLCAFTITAAPIKESMKKVVRGMVLDPRGFVHVAEDGIARSYASNGTVLDYAPLSNVQLNNMINNLPMVADAEREHLAETFAAVNGFAVKDLHQIYHPSTQLRPAIDPVQTHWQKEPEINTAHDSDATLDNRYAHCAPTSCSTGLECVGMGCDVCIIAHDMSDRFCHHGDF